MTPTEDTSAPEDMSAPDFRALFESAPDLYLVLRSDAPRFTIVAMSDAFARAMMTTGDQILGRGLFEVFPDIPTEPRRTGVGSNVRASLERVIRARVANATAEQKYEVPRPADEGGGLEERWSNSVSSPVFADSGELAYIIHRVEDVTELVRLRQTCIGLQNSASELQILAEQMASEHHELSEANVAISEAVGTSPEGSLKAVLTTMALQAVAFTGARYAALGIGTDPEQPFDPWVFVGMTPEVEASIGRHPRPVATLGVVARENQTIRVRDARRHPAYRGLPPHHPELSSFLGVPIRFRGRSVGNIYLANKRDADEFSEQDQHVIEMLAARTAGIVETARLYHNAGLSLAWLQMVVDQMPDGLLLLDATGRATARNRMLLGLSCGEAGKRDPFGNPIELDFRFPSGERVPPSELPYVRTIRQREPVHGDFVLVLRDGRMVSVVASTAPVLGKAGELIGATMVVQDVTATKELERLRDEWTSIVAHDLRQPVNVIRLSADLLSEFHPEPPETESRVVEHIRTAAKRLDRMIGDLLDASRIEARRLSVEKRATELRSLVEEVVERMPQIAARTHVLVAPGASVPVWIDAGRIEQVLNNLLSNAVKYGDPDGPIYIELAPRDDTVEVIVTNHGGGIQPDEIPHLFCRFERSREARAGQATGLGLGLYICRGLVEAHGGRIWVESTPGQTTSFHFTLPIAPLQVRPEEHPEAHPP